MNARDSNAQTMKDSLRSPSQKSEDQSQQDEEDHIPTPGLIAPKHDHSSDQNYKQSKREFTYRSTQKDTSQFVAKSTSQFQKEQENLRDSKTGGHVVSEGTSLSAQGPSSAASRSLNPAHGSSAVAAVKKVTTSMLEDLEEGEEQKDDTQSENLSEDEAQEQIQQNIQDEDQSDIDSDHLNAKRDHKGYNPSAHQNRHQNVGSRSISEYKKENKSIGLLPEQHPMSKSSIDKQSYSKPSKDSGPIPFAQQILKKSSIQQPQAVSITGQSDSIQFDKYSKNYSGAPPYTSSRADDHSIQGVINTGKNLGSASNQLLQQEGLVNNSKSSNSIILSAAGKRIENGSQVYQKQPAMEHHHSSELSSIQPQSYSSHYSGQQQTSHNFNQYQGQNNSLNNNAAATGFNNGRWNKTEHIRFLEALKLHGKNWKKVQQHVQTRSSTQARSHAQKFFVKLERKGTDLQFFLDNLDMDNLENLAADQLEFEDDDDEPHQKNSGPSHLGMMISSHNIGSHQINSTAPAQGVKRNTPPSTVENLRQNHVIASSEQIKNKPLPPKDELNGRNNSKHFEQIGKHQLQPSVIQKISTTNGNPTSQQEQKIAQSASIFTTNRASSSAQNQKPIAEPQLRINQQNEDSQSHRDHDQHSKQHQSHSTQAVGSTSGFIQGGHQSYQRERIQQEKNPMLPQMSSYQKGPPQNYPAQQYPQIHHIPPPSMHQGPPPPFHSYGQPYLIPSYHPYPQMIAPPLGPAHQHGYYIDGSQVQAMIFQGGPHQFNPYQAQMAQRQPIIYTTIDNNNIAASTMTYYPSPHAFVKQYQASQPPDHREGSAHYYGPPPHHHYGQPYPGVVREETSASNRMHHDPMNEGESSQQQSAAAHQ